MYTAEEIVNYMMANDAFSRWLGIEVDKIRPGHSRLIMTIREEMTNGFHIAHGGIVYSLADSALAFAANAHGKIAKTIQLTCQYVQSLSLGQQLFAEAIETTRTRKFAYYTIHIYTDNRLVATLQGMAYISERDWIIKSTSSGM